MVRTKLHVGSLAPDVTEIMLYSLFEKVGPVWMIKMKNYDSKKYAYIDFQEQADAERALKKLNNSIFEGRPLRIKWAESDTAKQRFENANLFIKNLPLSINNQDLFDIFSKYGEILSWQVSTDDSERSKGHGFVQFETEEAAELAILMINGKTLRGKELYVAKHQRQEERRKEKEESFTNVFVKNFSDELDDGGLKAIFEEYGKITSCKVMTDGDGNSKGFGFVNFETSEAAKKAVAGLHEAELICSDGRSLPLYVQRAQTKAEREENLKKESVKSQKEGANLYVKNLHESVNDARLRKMFSGFGKIVSAKVMMDENGKTKCFGFVSFSSAKEASEALNEMHDAKIASKTLYVAFAQDKEERKALLRFQHAQQSSPRRPMVVKSQHAGMRRAQSTPRLPSGFIQARMAAQQNLFRPCPVLSGAYSFTHLAPPLLRPPLLRPQAYPPILADKTNQIKKNSERKGRPVGGKNAVGTNRRQRVPVESSISPTVVRKPAK